MRGRFTAWFSAPERAALEAEAERLGATVNFVVRSAVRAYLGMEAPRQVRQSVTVVTRNQ